MAMQNMVNKVKSAALGVADSLTPVLKVMSLPAAHPSTLRPATPAGVQVQGVGDADS